MPTTDKAKKQEQNRNQYMKRKSNKANSVPDSVPNSAPISVPNSVPYPEPIQFFVLLHQTKKQKLHKELMKHIHAIKWEWNMDKLIIEYKEKAHNYFQYRQNEGLQV